MARRLLSWSGTSMATPHVAGVAALYLSKYPAATANQVNAGVTGGATPNVVTSAGTGSPNLLLYSLLTAAPPVLPKIHLAALAGSRVPGRKNWEATATATVHDATDGLISGALVSCDWALSSGTAGTGSCTTDTGGTCSYVKSGIKNKVASITFTVTGISKAGTIYDPVSNDPGTPTAVTVSKQ